MKQLFLTIVALAIPTFFAFVVLSSAYHRLRSLRQKIGHAFQDLVGPFAQEQELVGGLVAEWSRAAEFDQQIVKQVAESQQTATRALLAAKSAIHDISLLNDAIAAHNRMKRSYAGLTQQAGSLGAARLARANTSLATIESAGEEPRRRFNDSVAAYEEAGNAWTSRLVTPRGKLQVITRAA